MPYIITAEILIVNMFKKRVVGHFRMFLPISHITEYSIIKFYSLILYGTNLRVKRIRFLVFFYSWKEAI